DLPFRALLRSRRRRSPWLRQPAVRAGRERLVDGARPGHRRGR
ncbi:MAG: hypothetical protein AVDCRST_MAG40-1119, partial [uncultured Gemmatimonadaceae bacterium]